MFTGRKVYVYTKDLDSIELKNYVRTFENLEIDYLIYCKVEDLLNSCKNAIPDLILFEIDPMAGPMLESELCELLELDKLFKKVNLPFLISLGFENYFFEQFLERENISYFLVSEMYSECFIQSNFMYQIRSCLRKSLRSEVKVRIRPENQKLRVSVEGSILKLGEMGCTIISPFKFDESTQIFLDSNKLKKLKISLTDLKSCSNSHFLSKGSYSTDFYFRGLTEHSASKIRSARNRWGGMV